MSTSHERRDAQLKQVEIENLAKKLIVPTIDTDVKQALRNFGEPITYFGEGPAERRDRLKLLMAKLQVETGEATVPQMTLDILQKRTDVTNMPIDATITMDESNPGMFYTQGSKELQESRLYFAKYSLPRAKQRTMQQRDTLKLIQDAVAFDTEKDIVSKKRMTKKLKHFTNAASQAGDSRPISTIAIKRFKGDHMMTVTGAFTGLIKSWSVPECKKHTTFKGHEDRVTGIAFVPHSVDMDSGNLAFASGGADCVAKLWCMNDSTPLATLQGHTHRLARIQFHPCGRYLGTTSFDATWRLWDVEKKECVLNQDGHTRGVYGIAFHGDGSLVATSDLGGEIKVWDLRTGKCILPLLGHAKQVLSVDFSPNGYQCASAGDDNTVRIWDLRQKKTINTIPAHMKLISAVKYEPEYGRYLVTSSYDKSVKIWRSVDHKLIKSLEGHEHFVMGVDIAKGSTVDSIVSASYDRTWKLWAADELLDL